MKATRCTFPFCAYTDVAQAMPISIATSKHVHRVCFG